MPAYSIKSLAKFIGYLSIIPALMIAIGSTASTNLLEAHSHRAVASSALITSEGELQKLCITSRDTERKDHRHAYRLRLDDGQILPLHLSASTRVSLNANNGMWITGNSANEMEAQIEKGSLQSRRVRLRYRSNRLPSSTAVSVESLEFTVDDANPSVNPTNRLTIAGENTPLAPADADNNGALARARNIALNEPTVQNRNLVIFAFDYNDASAPSTSNIINDVFGAQNSANSLLKTSTYDRMVLDNTQSQVHRINVGRNFVPGSFATSGGIGSEERLLDQAVSNAIAQGLLGTTTALNGNLRVRTVEDFDHVVYVLPEDAMEGSVGIGVVGQRPSPALWSAISDSSGLSFAVTMAHELGHNLSLDHVWYGDLEYGDPYGFMGRGADPVGLMQRLQIDQFLNLGIFSAEHVKTMNLGTVNSDLIALNEVSTLPWENLSPYAIKVDNYYLTYRFVRPLRFFNFLPPEPALLAYEQGAIDRLVVETRPGNALQAANGNGDFLFSAQVTAPFNETSATVLFDTSSEEALYADINALTIELDHRAIYPFSAIKDFLMTLRVRNTADLPVKFEFVGLLNRSPNLDVAFLSSVNTEISIPAKGDIRLDLARFSAENISDSVSATFVINDTENSNVGSRAFTLSYEFDPNTLPSSANITLPLEASVNDDRDQVTLFWTSSTALNDGDWVYVYRDGEMRDLLPAQTNRGGAYTDSVDPNTQPRYELVIFQSTRNLLRSNALEVDLAPARLPIATITASPSTSLTSSTSSNTVTPNNTLTSEPSPGGGSLSLTYLFGLLSLFSWRLGFRRLVSRRLGVRRSVS